MTTQLQLTDIQGNIIQAYGRANFIYARYFFLQIRNGEQGRKFLDLILPKITSAKLWGNDTKGSKERPVVTSNIAFILVTEVVLVIRYLKGKTIHRNVYLGVVRKWLTEVGRLYQPVNSS